MLACAILCSIKAIKHFDSPVFARMLISVVSTYGVYVISSLMALDPWYVPHLSLDCHPLISVGTS